MSISSIIKEFAVAFLGNISSTLSISLFAIVFSSFNLLLCHLSLSGVTASFLLISFAISLLKAYFYLKPIINIID